MDVSIFLAKFFGLYLVITSLFIIAKRDTFKAVLADYFNHPALVLVNHRFSWYRMTPNFTKL